MKDSDSSLTVAVTDGRGRTIGAGGLAREVVRSVTMLALRSAGRNNP